MAEEEQTGGHVQGLWATLRHDKWWFEPLWTGIGFLIFAIYTTWAALQGEYYYVGGEHGGYLSPFYSPLLFVDETARMAAPVGHAWFGPWPDGLRSIWPPFLPISPAILILAAPLSFRMTCYYYRKFYYRAYFQAPTACAVQGLAQKKYKGETRLLLIQNIHRYTWYIAIAYILILYYDAYLAFWRDGRFGVGVGSIVLAINPTLLAMYTLGCHSCRHLVGGSLDCFTCDAPSRARHGIWKKVTALNEKHMRWAWISMIWVGLTDWYVRMVATGRLHDFNTWGI